MKQEVLKAWDLPWLPVAALMMFVLCFAAYTWWTFRRQNKMFFENVAQIPLNDAPMSSTRRTDNE